MIKTNVYMPVRKANDDGHEFADFGCMGFTINDVKHKVDQLAKEIPHWHKDNPVIRVSCFDVIETIIKKGV